MREGRRDSHLIEPKDKIKLADVLEYPIERLDEDLDKVEHAEFGFGQVAEEDEG